MLLYLCRAAHGYYALSLAAFRKQGGRQRRTGEPRVFPQKARPQKGLMRNSLTPQGPQRCWAGQRVRRATPCTEIWSGSLEIQVQFLAPKLCADLGQLFNL